MKYFAVGDYIRGKDNNVVWQITGVNQDGTLEVIYISGKNYPNKETKTIKRPENYRIMSHIKPAHSLPSGT